MQWILDPTKNTDSTFHHLSHVSRRKWRSKRRVLGFLWLLGTNFVGLAGETSFTHLNLSRKYGRGPMTFHENLIFSEWYVFFFGGIFGILRDEDDNHPNQRHLPPVMRFGTPLKAISWRLGILRTLLRVFVMKFGGLPPNLYRILHFETHWHIFCWMVPLQFQRMYFSYETPLLKSCVAGNFLSSLDFWSITCDFQKTFPFWSRTRQWNHLQDK